MATDGDVKGSVQQVLDNHNELFLKLRIKELEESLSELMESDQYYRVKCKELEEYVTELQDKLRKGGNDG